MNRPLFEFFGMAMAVLGLGVAYFAIYVGTRNEKIKRELQHKERMRALELGRPVPGESPWLTPLRIGFLIGLIVPIVALAAAAQATGKVGYSHEMWQAAAMVSVAAVVCGSVVTCVAATDKSRGSQAARYADKPAVDEDAYDVVSSRA